MELPGGHSWMLWEQQLAEALRQLESLADAAPTKGALVSAGAGGERVEVLAG
jgi:hypothetical protein